MSRLIKVDRSKERFAALLNGFADWLSKAKLTDEKKKKSTTRSTSARLIARQP